MRFRTHSRLSALLPFTLRVRPGLLWGVCCQSTQSPILLVDQSPQTNSELLGRKWSPQGGRARPAAGRVSLLGWDAEQGRGHAKAVPGTWHPLLLLPAGPSLGHLAGPSLQLVQRTSRRAFPHPMALPDLKDSSALRTDCLLVLSAVGSGRGLTLWCTHIGWLLC